MFLTLFLVSVLSLIMPSPPVLLLVLFHHSEIQKGYKQSLLSEREVGPRVLVLDLLHVKVQQRSMLSGSISIQSNRECIFDSTTTNDLKTQLFLNVQPAASLTTTRGNGLPLSCDNLGTAVLVMKP